MFNIEQFRELIIKPALSDLQLYSDNAEELLVFTCAAESHGGTWISQIKGPAVGIYQCEPDTHYDIWVNYIFHRPDFLHILAMNFNAPNIQSPERLIVDLKYSTAIARLHYRRIKEALPDKEDVDAIWEYYKKYYNTKAGKSKKDKAIQMYNEFRLS